MRRSRSPDPAVVAKLIQQRCDLGPTLGIVLGSGFAPLGESVSTKAEFAFRELPGFPVGGVLGHQPSLILGTWQGVDLAMLRGRAHYYEGFDLTEVTFPTRVLAELGVQMLLVTNAAGGLNPKFRPGDFMVLRDHINLMGGNPLRGPIAPGQNRFVDLTAAYDASLQLQLRNAAKAVGARCYTGVYLAVSGPSYETAAEIRAFRRLGADAVGMSTVPEVIVARQCGLRVAGLSCITNVAAVRDGQGQAVSHAEVLAVAKDRAQILTSLVGEFIKRLASPA